MTANLVEGDQFCRVDAACCGVPRPHRSMTVRIEGGINQIAAVFGSLDGVPDLDCLHLLEGYWLVARCMM